MPTKLAPFLRLTDHQYRIVCLLLDQEPDPELHNDRVELGHVARLWWEEDKRDIKMCETTPYICKLRSAFVLSKILQCLHRHAIITPPPIFSVNILTGTKLISIAPAQ